MAARCPPGQTNNLLKAKMWTETSAMRQAKGIWVFRCSGMPVSAAGRFLTKRIIKRKKKERKKKDIFGIALFFMRNDTTALYTFTQHLMMMMMVVMMMMISCTLV